jgi:DnaD/phage-associated family protein
MDQSAAAEYINRCNRQQEKLPRMMALLGLTGRKPSLSEERYLLSWSEMGFDDDVIEKAYDKTILKCKELRWPYLNKILCNWHKAGFHTVEEVTAGDRRPRAAQSPADTTGAGDNLARMKKYLQEMKK